MRNVVVLAIVAALSMSAAPPKPLAPVAPEALPHSIALFLGSLSNEGGRHVTFKARAHGIRFFFEEPTGVTVYRFDNGRYVREEFLRGFTLERAVRRYAQK
ncbi:MAG: hypothetical protein ACXW31_17135 [Thermoanaerobaculia bacterium]